MTRLAIVKPAVEEPIDQAEDIYAAIRKRRDKIDWSAVHIRGDRAPAVNLPDRIRGVVRL